MSSTLSDDAKAFMDYLARCDHGTNAGLPGVCPEDRGEQSGNAQRPQAAPPAETETAHTALHQKAAQKAGQLLKLAAKIPAKVYRKAKEKVVGHYQKLSARYGKKTAILIVGAGLLGTATPVPGGGLLAASPIIAAAELYVRLTGSAKYLTPEVKAWLKSDSFFGECDRDELGHCKPGEGHGQSEGDGKEESSEKPGSSGASENPSAREQHEQAHAAWQERSATRDKQRASLDAVSDKAAYEHQSAVWGKISALDDVVIAGSAEGVGDKLSTLISEHNSYWTKTETTLADAGADEKDLAKFQRLRERAESAIGKKADSYATQAEKTLAAKRMVAELETVQPKEPPAADYLDAPPAPDAAAFASEEEFDAAYEAWEKESDAVDAENDKRSAAYDKAYDKWVADDERWQAKYEKATDKANAEEEKLQDRFSELSDTMDEWQDDLVAESDAIATAAVERLDAADEEDTEPEEPDEPEEDGDSEEKHAPATVRKSLDASAPPIALDVSVILQEKDAWCGPAALGSAAAFLGVNKGQDELAALLGTDSHGTPPDALVRGAEELGLSADAKGGMTLADLHAALSAGSPVICAVQASGDGSDEDRGHYVTVYGMTPDSLLVMDPEVGRKRIGRELFEARWHDRAASGELFDHWGLVLSKAPAKAIPVLVHKSHDDPAPDFDPVASAELIADILGGLFGDDAASLFPAGEAEAEGAPDSKGFQVARGVHLTHTKGKFNELDHPRGAHGRFIPKGSAEAVASAKESIGGIVKLGEQGKSPEHAQKLAQHLSILTVKQLHELKKEYGLKASAKVRDELVAKILDRLPGAQKRIDAERGAAAQQLGLPEEASVRDIVEHIAVEAGYPEHFLTKQELDEKLDALGVSVPVQRGEAVREAFNVLREGVREKKPEAEAKPEEKPAEAAPEPEPAPLTAADLRARTPNLDLDAIRRLNNEISDMETLRVAGEPMQPDALERLNALKDERDRLAGVKPGEYVNEFEMQQLTRPEKKPKNPKSPLDNSSSIGDNTSGGGNESKPEEPKMSPVQLLDMAARDEYSSILPKDLLTEYSSKLGDAEDGLEEGDFEPYQDFLNYLRFLSTTHDGAYAQLGDLIRADARYSPNKPAYTPQEEEWGKKPRSNRGRDYRDLPGR